MSTVLGADAIEGVNLFGNELVDARSRPSPGLLRPELPEVPVQLGKLSRHLPKPDLGDLLDGLDLPGQRLIIPAKSRTARHHISSICAFCSLAEKSMKTVLSSVNS